MAKGKIVVRKAIKRDPRFIYFIDRSGNIRAVKRKGRC